MLLKKLIFGKTTGCNHLKMAEIIFGHLPPIAANIYLFEVNYRHTRKRCEISSKLTIKTPERRLTFNTFYAFLSVSIVYLEQVNVY